MRTTKKTAAALLAVFALGVLSGCGDDGANDTGGKDGAGGKTENDGGY